jgi:hypothetical protein
VRSRMLAFGLYLGHGCSFLHWYLLRRVRSRAGRRAFPASTRP